MPVETDYRTGLMMQKAQALAVGAAVTHDPQQGSPGNQVKTVENHGVSNLKKKEFHKILNVKDFPKKLFLKDEKKGGSLQKSHFLKVAAVNITYPTNGVAASAF